MALFGGFGCGRATGANAGAGEDCVSLGLIRELLVKKLKHSLTFSPKTRGVLLSDAREFGGLRKGCPTLATP